MVKFGLDNFVTEIPNWSKHHKTIGVRVKRVYDDGEVMISEDETILELLKKYEDKLKENHVNLFVRSTGERRHAVDYYLPIKNLDYEESNLDYYMVGAMNTAQTTYFRLRFLVEDLLFVLSANYKSSGTYATSFSSYIDGMHNIESIIDEIIEEGKPIEDVGISAGDDADYKIVVVTPYGEVEDIEVDKHDLLNSLIGIEVYKFEQEIKDC